MNEKQISLLAAFLAAGVEYAVVGGVAVNAHGYVRATNGRSRLNQTLFPAIGSVRLTPTPLP
jgi:hypothetical protein